MQYSFEWDINKNKTNQQKHSVSFELAATVFRDPRTLTIFDDKHSDIEERWITLGLSSSGGILVIHHTFKDIINDIAVIRIFSSRKASKNEIQQYTE
jgi:uncharacterized DUF497 family protein